MLRRGGAVTSLRVVLIVWALAALLGCAPSAAPSQDAASAAPAPEVKKTVTLAQLNSVKAYAPWDFSDTAGGGVTLVEIHSISLVTKDAQGNRVGQLAARVP